MDVLEIDGAGFFLDAEPGDWRRVRESLSPDRTRLACIYSAPGGFRVQRFARRSGAPQWRGDWWFEQTGASLADSRERAESLVAEYLHAEGGNPDVG